MSEQQGELQREGGAKQRPQPGKAAPPEHTERQREKRVPTPIGVSLLLAAGFIWRLHARKFEDTDNAQIDGYISAVSSRVAGTVLMVLVEDNQPVKEGDLLVELDKADLEVALAQARASVAQAQAALE